MDPGVRGSAAVTAARAACEGRAVTFTVQSSWTFPGLLPGRAARGRRGWNCVCGEALTHARLCCGTGATIGAAHVLL